MNGAEPSRFGPFSLSGRAGRWRGDERSHNGAAVGRAVDGARGVAVLGKLAEDGGAGPQSIVFGNHVAIAGNAATKTTRRSNIAQYGAEPTKIWRNFISGSTMHDLTV